MISEVEHFFIYLLDIWMSYLEKCLFKSLANLKTGLFGFLLLGCMSFLYFMYINPLSDMAVNLFSQSIDCRFMLLIVFFGRNVQALPRILGNIETDRATWRRRQEILFWFLRAIPFVIEKIGESNSRLNKADEKTHEL